ncbi:MAG: lysozyme, partial [Holophaga sp.]|nr:lysozyme [Holophaga sp.]
AAQTHKNAKLKDAEESKDTKKKEASQTMSLSDKGADALKQYEKIVMKDGKAVMYDNDGSKNGNATIGYGHMIHTGKIDGSASETPYKNGISTEEATKLFKADAKSIVDAVNGMLKVGVSQQQFDALVSLAFNIGPGKAGGKNGLINSDVMKKLNSGDPKGAAEAFKTHNKDAGTGKAVQGLTNRRAKEVDMFLNGVY